VKQFGARTGERYALIHWLALGWLRPLSSRRIRMEKLATGCPAR